MATRVTRRTLALLPLLGALLAACAQPNELLPEAEQVAGYYPTSRDLSVELNGNVAEVSVQQPADQLRRGGALWAKVGPYVFLFTEGTRDLMRDFPALAGVRVITTGPGGAEVARAFLHRDELNDFGWRRALNIAGRARLEGSERVTTVEELVRWGEDHTTYEYNPTYITSR